jgi:hypothetical protein
MTLLLGGFLAGLPARLVVEPKLRDKHREQAEDDGKADHYESAGAHLSHPLVVIEHSCSLFRP